MSNIPINIQFLGAAGTVTGSKYIISAAGKKGALQALLGVGVFLALKMITS